MINSYNMDHDNRLLFITLALSLGLHVAGVAALAMQRSASSVKKARDFHVTYQSMKMKTVRAKAAPAEKMRVAQAPPFVKDIEILNKKDTLAPPNAKAIQDISKLPEKLRLSRKISPTVPMLEGERRVTIPILSTEKITNPQYLSYNQSIRERIKQRAYQYVNHPDFKAGSVYLTFILKSDGTLKDIKVIEEKTAANDYLRAIGIRSIKESTPFTPFPANLTFPELTFNVVMSFEMK